MVLSPTLKKKKKKKQLLTSWMLYAETPCSFVPGLFLARYQGGRLNREVEKKNKGQQSNDMKTRVGEGRETSFDDRVHPLHAPYSLA
jgi:hypothetical protein